MIVGVGSKNPVKVQAATDVFDAVFGALDCTANV